MKCNEMLLEDYVEGFLTSDEQKEIEAHLTGCAECKGIVEQLRAEQQLLMRTLSKTESTSNVTNNLMQKISQQQKKKSSRQRYKIAFITAAILLISFALIATQGNPVQQVNTVPNTPLHQQTDEHPEVMEEPKKHTIPLTDEPALVLSIDHMIEKNGMKEIIYRSKYNDELQKYAEETLDILVRTYQLDEQQFTLGWGSLISVLVRNSKGEVLTTFEMPDSIERLYPLVSLYRGQTESVGEETGRFSLPADSDPATLEVSGYHLELYTFADIDPFTITKDNVTSFDYLGHNYTIVDMFIDQDDLKLSIIVDGQPEVIPSGWQIAMEGTYYHNFTFDQYENNQTKLTVIIPELNKIPDQLTLVPYRGRIEERFEQPIRLDLKAAQK